MGREQKLLAAQALVRRKDVGLLTLTGPGGSGKTRLGLQIAAELVKHFEGRVFFVTLAPIRDPDLVALTISHTLGIQDSAHRAPLESLKHFVRDKSVLLVLDNFEQILGAAPQISELLSAGPGLKVLVTSRAALRIRDEHEFPVPPLALPSSDAPTTPEVLAQCASVAMFIERAAAIKTRASWGMWFPASNLGSVAAAQGYAQRAVCLAGAATTITEAIGVAMVPSHRTDYEDALATARQALSTSEFDAVWSKGISMTLELAVDYALSSEDESLV